MENKLNLNKNQNIRKTNFLTSSIHRYKKNNLWLPQIEGDIKKEHFKTNVKKVYQRKDKSVIRYKK